MDLSVSGTTNEKRIWKNLGGASVPLVPLDPPMEIALFANLDVIVQLGISDWHWTFCKS